MTKRTITFKITYVPDSPTTLSCKVYLVYLGGIGIGFETVITDKSTYEDSNSSKHDEHEHYQRIPLVNDFLRHKTHKILNVA